MESLPGIVFWLSLFLFLYSVILYQAVLFALAVFIKSPVRKREIAPRISVLIAAYNEEDLIEDCILSLLCSDYPADKMEILVGSDGSTDSTDNIVKRLAGRDDRVRLYSFIRAGKNSVMAELVSESGGELIFFMDADTRTATDTLRKAVSCFDDTETGMVICRMDMEDAGDENRGNSGRKGDTAYQRFESYLRVKETSISTTVNSLGALYGLRRELVSLATDSRLCDDLVPVFETIAARKRVIYSDEARVREVRKKSLGNEFKRRIRASACGLSTMYSYRRLLRPDYGMAAFFLWSHKVVRPLLPFYLIALILSSGWLSIEAGRMNLVSAMLIAIAFAGLAGYIAEKMKKNVPFLKVAYYFWVMNLGLLLAFFHFLKGKDYSKWSHARATDS